MTLQPARLDSQNKHPLRGRAINRDKPLRFRLDGRVISGFAGDTVLSAALASGINCLGQSHGMAMALGMSNAPAICQSGAQADGLAALPMDRTPALDGVHYVTLGHKMRRGVMKRLLRRDRHSLSLDLDRSDRPGLPWLDQAGNAAQKADLVVIGGGIAGMTAAVAGAKRGLRVVLIEAQPWLGGRARLFGTQDGEETPDQSIDRLRGLVESSDAISVLLSAAVFALRPGLVRLHQVVLEGDHARGVVRDIAAQHVIVATGSQERLPVFGGNRLPGVVGIMEAYDLAYHYGVWPGRSAIVATSSSPAYRLAMMASDAGIALRRVVDSRPRPQSRFIEFSRAYGITQAPGTIITAVAADRGKELQIQPQLAGVGLAQSEAMLAADRLVVCGGWQPDLALWLMAGGQSAWNADQGRLEPTVPPTGIAIAGSAAGWLSAAACLASGTKAVEHMLGRAGKPITETLIDPLYETPDGHTPIGAPLAGEQPPAYLGSGRGSLIRPLAPTQTWRSRLPFMRKPVAVSLTDTHRPLDASDIVAGVLLGAIPPDVAGIIAQERVAMPGLEPGARLLLSREAAPMPPRYLAARYSGAELFVVAADDGRALETGALIQADADETDPLKAIGVIVRSVEGAAIALVRSEAGQTASVRVPGRAIAITLMAPWRPGMDLAAALGGGARAF